MIRSWLNKLGFLTIALFLFNTLPILPAWASPPKHRYKPDSLIVKYKQGLASVATVETELGASRVKQFRSGARLLKLPEGSSVEDAVEKLKNSSMVEYAEPDYQVTIDSFYPNDPDFSDQWGLDNSLYPEYDIQAPEAWEISTGNSDIVVAVIDSGIDFSHPDLAHCAWVNPGEIPDNGIDDDYDGYIDDINGWNFVDGNNCVYDSETHWHGTHAAGIIAAQMNNSIGGAGVAPNIKLMSLQFLNSNGSGKISDAVAAIDYAAAHGVKILNNSWSGGVNYSLALYDAIAASNALFVVSAGNDGWNTDVNPVYPACYDLDNIISIAAYTNNGEKASFSNYGLTSVDLAAPGSEIYSTYPVVKGSYSWASGTSMAAPFVSGTAALLLAHDPSLSSSELKQKIMTTCDPIPAFSGRSVSGGIVNAYRALTSNLSSAKDFTSFSLADQTGPAAIDTSSHTVNITVKRGTDLTSLVPVFTLSPGASATINGVDQVSEISANDFNSPVLYQVKAEDNSIVGWIVTVTVESWLYGDVNEDGLVDGFDALDILFNEAQLFDQMSVNATATLQTESADVNGSGAIDGFDALEILLYEAHLYDLMSDAAKNRLGTT